ncbi:hypothetical protein AVEN_165046-1 [Araneus ventricosus]|uniref:Uncharacterized protein n=1 Tax=Araneus ventricosus TaxID=182803 RepID=A0A4Y2JAU8_ARAVE|nr:hypothetical protein AVEN_165046-1 [Araneus ventricosus]
MCNSYDCRYAEGIESMKSGCPGKDIPVAAILTDLEIFEAVYEQDQAINVDDSDGDERVEETFLVSPS